VPFGFEVVEKPSDEGGVWGAPRISDSG